jgi:hypothetical protein
MDTSSLASSALDVLPFPVFIVDNDVRIVAMNESAARLVGPATRSVLMKRGGEALQCINHARSPAGCGSGAACATCVIRNSVNAAIAGQPQVHRHTRLELGHEEHAAEAFVLVSAARFQSAGTTYAVLVLQDLSEIVATGSVLPVCMECKRVRRDGTWERMEHYLHATIDLKLSHGICPSCMRKVYPEDGDDTKPPSPAGA